MKSIKVLLGVAALVLITSSAQAQTPATLATPAAVQATDTPVPTASPMFNKATGTSAAWTSKVGFGSCIVNPASIASGRSALYNCTALGAATTDKVFVNAQPTNTASTTPFVVNECWYLQGATVTAADTIQFRIVNREMQGVQAANACDPPAITVDYMLLRPNTQY